MQSSHVQRCASTVAPFDALLVSNEASAVKIFCVCKWHTPNSTFGEDMDTVKNIIIIFTPTRSFLYYRSLQSTTPVLSYTLPFSNHPWRKKPWDFGG